MKDTYEYDVAFSFAGEDREYVEKVATFLKSQNISVFYDYFEEEKLWGKNLVLSLEEIYTHKSKYCVIFISQYYVKKEWTRYESIVAMSQMLENNKKQKEYILPVKFDETKVPGIPNTIGYVDGKKKTPEQLGELIIKKVHEKSNKTACTLTFEKFKTSLIEMLSADFPYYWHVTCNETVQQIEFRYFFTGFEYHLKVIEESENVLLISEGCTDVFLDTHIFIPSAKITLTIEDKIIKNAQIINYDFFDCMEFGTLSPFEIIEMIKEQILKKGGL